MDLQVVPAGRIIDAAPKPRVPMFSQRSLLGQGQAQHLCETRRAAGPQWTRRRWLTHCRSDSRWPLRWGT